MRRVCEEVVSLSDAINKFCATGRVTADIPKSKKATDKLKMMTKEELVEFAKYLYSPVWEKGDDHGE